MLILLSVSFISDIYPDAICRQSPENGENINKTRKSRKWKAHTFSHLTHPFSHFKSISPVILERYEMEEFPFSFSAESVGKSLCYKDADNTLYALLFSAIFYEDQLFIF